MLEQSTEQTIYSCAFTVVPNAFIGLECSEYTCYDLIIAKREMQHLAAADMLSVLRAVGSMTPIVLLIDEKDDTDDRKAQSLGFFSVLRKPLSTRVLCNLIETIISRSEDISGSNSGSGSSSALSESGPTTYSHSDSNMNDNMTDNLRNNVTNPSSPHDYPHPRSAAVIVDNMSESSETSERNSDRNSERNRDKFRPSVRQGIPYPGRESVRERERESQNQNQNQRENQSQRENTIVTRKRSSTTIQHSNDQLYNNHNQSCENNDEISFTENIDVNSRGLIGKNITRENISRENIGRENR